MRYNKIKGQNISECMMKLRSKYGTSAMILATREIKEGGILGSGLFSKKMYEIDFMIEEGELRKKRKNSELVADGPRIRPAKFKKIEKKKEAENLSIPSDVQIKENRAIESKSVATLPENNRNDIISILKDSEPIVSNSRGKPITESEENSGENLKKGNDEYSFAYLHKIRERMISSNISRDYTENFIQGLDNSLSHLEKREYKKIEEKSLEKMAQTIRTIPDISPPRGESMAVMLMGPTGSGKTTSLAKLAAKCHLFQHYEVSLYSLDHYRLAATEQLKTYASVMELPFYSPINPAEFRESLERDGSEIMLIDTSGISHKDKARISELKEFIDVCEIRLEKHLVLAANTNPDLLEKILLAYDELLFDKIILTKLDEADFIGAFIEHADKFNRPFSFLMNGQEVPGDIMEPSPIDMARMVLRNELVKAE